MLLVVSNAAPILAPLLGGQLLRVTDWRGLFVALAALGAVILARHGPLFVPETHPPGRRRLAAARPPSSTLHVFREPLLRA